MRDLKDRINESIGRAADKAADKTGKVRVGFEPSVCEGCEHRQDNVVRSCGLCGCPTIRHGTLHLSGMVPGGCPRIEQHRRQSSED